MKLLKKLMVVFVALFMVMSLTNTIMADEESEAEDTTITITVHRDSTYKDTASGNTSAAEGDRTYTYYKVFDAAYTGTGEAADASGVSYTLSADDPWVAVLGGTWEKAEGAAEETFKPTDENQVWVSLKKSADGTKYIVNWVNADDTDDSETVKAFAAYLLENKPASGVTTGTLEGVADSKDANGNFTEWSKEVTKGYYLIVSSEGENLVAATADVDINEKNTYPTLDKTQKDTADGTFGDAKVNVAIGDTIYYQVKVTVPADANQDIVITDEMTTGLTYNKDIAVTNEGLTANTDYEISGTQVTIKATEKTKGTDVLITYSATVNENALTDLSSAAVEDDPETTDVDESADATYGRRNTATLNYHNGAYVMTDYVEYTTYYTGIKKVAESETGDPLPNVKFAVTVDGEDFNVKAVTETTGEGEDAVTTVLYYIPDTAEDGSNIVVTDDQGLIIIRGLDKEVTYTLTETETVDGYNLLDAPKGLTPSAVDEAKDVPTTAANSFDKVVNKSGTVLPSTGGIGTTIFYVLGSALVLGAGVILVAKKRVNN